MQHNVNAIFEEHIEVARAACHGLEEGIKKGCEFVAECFKTGNKVLLFGNGGSAADAQHIAAEFVGRFLKERHALPAIALTTDSSAFTSIGNDYGFEQVFERQVQAFAKPGDVLIGISTSGNSPNVVKALKWGNAAGNVTIGLSGRLGGLMNECCDLNIVVPSDVTARIQEIHILIGHIFCSAVDSVFD